MRAGHRLPDIQSYTLAQLRAFLRAEASWMRQQASLALNLIAVASQGDRQSIGKAQRELDRED